MLPCQCTTLQGADGKVSYGHSYQAYQNLWVSWIWLVCILWAIFIARLATYFTIGWGLVHSTFVYFEFIFGFSASVYTLDLDCYCQVAVWHSGSCSTL